MRYRRTAVSIAVAGLLGLWFAAAAHGDGETLASDVQNRDGNASPSAAESDINDYTFQDEQINIDGNTDAVVKVLRVDQKNLINDYRIRTFPIKNASPIEMRGAFRQILALEGGRAEVIRDKNTKDYWLWVAAPDFMIPYIEEAVKGLDVEWLSADFDGSLDAYYKAKFRDIAEINRLAVIPAAGSSGTSVVDDVNNAVLRTGEPYRTQNYAKYAKVVDKPIPRLLLEAAVYEVDVSREKRLGLDWIAWKNGPGRNLFEFVYWAVDYDQNARDATSKFDPFVAERLFSDATFDGNQNGYWSSWNYVANAAFVDFLEGVGRAQLVTKGKVHVKNSETGTLSAVDEVIHFVVQPDEHTTPVDGIEPFTPFRDGEILEEDEFEADIPLHNRTLDKDGVIELGFVMEVRPLIAEETTELQIHISLNSMVGMTPSGAPQVRTHSQSTTVLVRDGVPICIGGIRRTEDVKNTAKVPILGSIPVLGYLFGHEATVKRETEMVIVLTPTIRLGTEADLEMADEGDALVRKPVLGAAKLRLPKTQYGFDQWLIDNEP